MPLGAEQIERLDQFLTAWTEPPTPYMAGQCCKGVGVDCVRFADAAKQAAFGLSLEPLPVFAQDAAFHDIKVIREIHRLLMTRFNGQSMRWPIKLQAGDLLGVRSKQVRNPHHLVIVGKGGVKCYHATPPRVVWLGIGGLLANYEIKRVYRSRMGNG